MLDSVGNEENAYPLPDPKNSKINATREPSNAHKNTLKEESFMKALQPKCTNCTQEISRHQK
jgi:hypothetical protein